jgi:hypothetical protein
VLLHLDRLAEADESCRQLETLLDDRDEGMAQTRNGWRMNSTISVAA